MNHKLHFQRFELKYLITNEQERILKQVLGPYLVADPFVENAAHGLYEVLSLYFDSPAFYYYSQKKDGVADRKKVRLRTYRAGDQLMPYFFVELKRRRDAVVLKDRFVVADTSLGSQFVTFRDMLPAGNPMERLSLVAELERERLRRALSPTVLVSYEREPYLGRFNQNFRVTFDRNIKAIANHNLFYQGEGWSQVGDGRSVLEIKFTGTVPEYVARAIRNLELERVSFSKYCQGVEACGLIHYAEALRVKRRLRSAAMASRTTNVLYIS